MRVKHIEKLLNIDFYSKKCIFVIYLIFHDNRLQLKKHIRNIALYPFSLVYGLVIAIRNWLFDIEIIRSTRFNIPIISVGNLAAGGTGKTPHTEFILSILKNEWKSAVLSRGYKRSTKGFILADENSNCATLGDEPFQIYQKFPDVTVAVDEKRVHGVKKLQELIPNLQLVVLDDAFQHRYIQAGFSILLTDFANMYTRDMLLPAGNLREWKSGSKRADMIIVTKCPDDFKPIDMRLVETELKAETNQQLFFSHFVYDEIVPVFPDSFPEKWNYQKVKEKNANVLLVAGIVSPESIVIHLNNFTDTVKTLFFDDHHAFQPKDFSLISQTFDKLPLSEKILLVTEKDASRLVSNPNFPETLKSRTFALPIRVEILHDQESLFIQKIKDYVIEDSRNR
jgi:tetraacyldisaccharide 4'-kinase